MSQQAAFNKLVGSRSNELHNLIEQWKSGRLSIDDLGDEYYDVLRRGHTEAYTLGAKQAGSKLEPSVLQTLAEQHGRAQADAEQEWLDGFLSDLESDKYTDDEGKVNLSRINNRASMYAHKLRGTANQAFVDESPNDATYDWVMSGTEAHCNDCPRLAALSPYSADELFATPGSCDTECLTGCKCFLRRSDGVPSIKRPS